MFSSWSAWFIYVLVGLAVLAATSILSRRGLKESLERPIVKGFGPPCTLWQAWKLFCSFFWERVLLIGVVVTCIIRLSLGNWRWFDPVILAAIIAAFPFQEYLVHMFLLHRPPIKLFGRRFESTIALVHRVHHYDPWHMQRAINPPVALVWYAFGLPALFFPIFAPAQAMTGVAGSWLVLLIYEWIHLLIHTSHVPRNWLFKRIWRNHRLHHFKNENYWYNVSTYGVDALLGTQPKPNGVPTSPTCLTLDVGETEDRAPPREPPERKSTKQWDSHESKPTTNAAKRSAPLSQESAGTRR